MVLNGDSVSVISMLCGLTRSFFWSAKAGPISCGFAPKCGQPVSCLMAVGQDILTLTSGGWQGADQSLASVWVPHWPFVYMISWNTFQSFSLLHQLSPLNRLSPNCSSFRSGLLSSILPSAAWSFSTEQPEQLLNHNLRCPWRGAPRVPGAAAMWTLQTTSCDFIR